MDLEVPVLPNGRDKLLYLVEHDSDWNGVMHTAVRVGSTQVERFLSTYDNPFARHWTGKSWGRYIAARVPASVIPHGARFLDVQIDMSKQTRSIHMREMGTHDLDLPRSV